MYTLDWLVSFLTKQRHRLGNCLNCELIDERPTLGNCLVAVVFHNRLFSYIAQVCINVTPTSTGCNHIQSSNFLQQWSHFYEYTDLCDTG